MKKVPIYAFLPYEWAIENNISGIAGPRNLMWEKKVTFSSALEYMSPSSSKKIFKAREFAEKELGYTFHLNEGMEKEDYVAWVQLYRKNLGKKEFGVAWISEDWYDREQHKVQYGSIFIKDNKGKVIAGVMMNKKTLIKMVSCDFRAHEYIKIKDSSLSALLEMCIDEYALKYGFNTITRGTDENIYGIRISKGLADFKKSYHFVPHPLDASASYYKRVLVFFEKFTNIMTFEYSDSGIVERLISETTITPLTEILDL